MHHKYRALFEKDRKRIAVIGLTEPQMSRRQPPESGFVFRDPQQALADVIAEVRRESPDFVILVWHNSYFSRQGTLSRFLRKFPEIDLVIGGHSHQENPGQIAGRAYFIQTGSHAGYIGAVRMEDKEIVSKLIPPESSSPVLEPLIREVAGQEKRAAETFVEQDLFPARKLLETMGTHAAVVTYSPPLKSRMTLLEHYKAFPYDDRYTRRFFLPLEFEEFCRLQKKKQKRWKMTLDIAGELPPEGGWVALSYYLAGEFSDFKSGKKRK